MLIYARYALCCHLRYTPSLMSLADYAIIFAAFRLLLFVMPAARWFFKMFCRFKAHAG